MAAVGRGPVDPAAVVPGAADHDVADRGAFVHEAVGYEEVFLHEVVDHGVAHHEVPGCRWFDAVIFPRYDFEVFRALPVFLVPDWKAAPVFAAWAVNPGDVRPQEIYVHPAV